MTAEQFVSALKSSMSELDSVSLKIQDAGTWPHFEIAGGLAGEAFVQGHYCEGECYLQVGLSSREEFIKHEASANEFLTLIRQIVQEIGHHGCVEKRWLNANGQIICSQVQLSLSGSKVYTLGKRPHFWNTGLKLTTKRFEPFTAAKH